MFYDRRLVPSTIILAKLALTCQECQFGLFDFSRLRLYTISAPYQAPLAQLDRALVSGTKGCRFEPCAGYQDYENKYQNHYYHNLFRFPNGWSYCWL